MTLICKGAAAALFASALAVPAAAGWTGTYVGLYAGQTTTEADWETAQPDLSLEGATIGVLAGAMFDAGPLVFGVEGDLTYIDGSDRANCSVVAFQCEVEVDFAGSARVRAGVPLGPVLAYATAGIAFRGITSSTSEIIPTEDEEFLTGWTAGGGLEVSVMDQVRLGVEYRHFEFGAANELSALVSPGEYDVTADEIHLRIMIPLQ